MPTERRSVLRRALRIPDTFSDADGLSLSEISRGAGVPLTTTHRIVSDLHEWARWSATTAATTASGRARGRSPRSLPLGRLNRRTT